MSNAKTEKREVDSLIECAAELNCSNLVIVTNNEERTIVKDGFRIDVVPVAKWSVSLEQA
jgi:predicted AAA+ superfamily ATPase